MEGNTWRGVGFMGGRMMRKAGLAWLSALMVALFMSGCAHEQPALSQAEVKDLVHKVITDPARADKVATLMGQLNVEISNQMKAKLETQQRFAKLNQDYNATPEQFEQFFEDVKKTQEKNRTRIMEIYFQIKGLTSPQEWEALCKPEMQNLQDYLKKMEEASKK